jgi:hypothetical protein
LPSQLSATINLHVSTWLMISTRSNHHCELESGKCSSVVWGNYYLPHRQVRCQTRNKAHRIQLHLKQAKKKTSLRNCNSSSEILFLCIPNPATGNT